ncbi:MAG: DUF87 domain-containing protein [Bacteriovoracaceae bacterium]|nr:DUF87 domain-containing protein [Bacteriovoracaceae bacterium]
MKQKILRIELLSLFVLTLLSCLYFYYKERLPDHFLQISSSNTSAPFYLYYPTSLLALIGFYTGPWLFFPFVAFAIIYILKFSKRDMWTDTLCFFSVSLFFLCFFSLFSPVLVGEGLQFAFRHSMHGLIIFTLMIVAANLSFLAIFGKTYINFLRNASTAVVAFIMKLSEKKKPSEETPEAPLATPEEAQEETQEETQENPLLSFDQLMSESSSDKDENLENEDTISVQSAGIVKVAQELDLQKEVEEEAELEEINAEVIPFKTKKNLEKPKFNSEALIACIEHHKVSNKKSHPDDTYFQGIIKSIQDKFQEFKLDAKIINILKGPVVDTFETELGSGVKVSRITAMIEDLSLALCGAPIRMVYPLKGRTTIGIEVPRNPREVIYLDEILKSQAFEDSHVRLPIAMGKNAFGETVVVDLAEMPHMLIAGSTGAGKSVFINTLLVSLLVKMPADKMKLILVDPKQLELALYGNLPHLILPVVTEPKMASLSLMWACEEMEKRYTILKELGVRNIEGYNRKITKASPDLLSKVSSYYEDREDAGYELPYLVIIVDEFADLILTKYGKDIEVNICRLAAKARACGIHLVLATQRPSVDVITGLIKSNFPTRVSFRVTSNIDSRTILNAMGAEKLLGKGDMLYKHGVEMTRVHAAYVDENEIEVLVDKLGKEKPVFDISAMNFLEKEEEDEANSAVRLSFGGGSSGEESGGDKLFNEAVGVVREFKMASASMLQRRLKIGYNRAANLIEQMEQKGIVGPQQGSKPREVLGGTGVNIDT